MSGAIPLLPLYALMALTGQLYLFAHQHQSLKITSESATLSEQTIPRVLDFHTAAAVPLVWSWLPDNWCAVTQTISRLIENWGFGNSFSCGWASNQRQPL